MDWAHTISEADGDHAVTFDISVTGPTSPILAPVLRRILRRELPPTVDKLIALAERTRAHRPST
jgi:siroheme synthase (precorrin-2 oxidase/ferrochelatase)